MDTPDFNTPEETRENEENNPENSRNLDPNDPFETTEDDSRIKTDNDSGERTVEVLGGLGHTPEVNLNSPAIQAAQVPSGPRPEELEQFQSPTLINSKEAAKEAQDGADALKRADEEWLESQKQYTATYDKDDPRKGSVDGNGFNWDWSYTKVEDVLAACRDYVENLQASRFSNDHNLNAGQYIGRAIKELEEKRVKELAEVNRIQREEDRKKDAEQLKEDIQKDQ